MRFRINFASQPYQRVQRFLAVWRLAIAAASLMALGLAIAATAAYSSWRTARFEVRELEKQIAELDRRKKDVEGFLNREDNVTVRDRAELLNSMIARKAFSWTEVFSDLERVIPHGLHVKSIHPRVSDDDQLELHLLVSGPSREAALEVVRRMEQSSHFSQPRIEAESFQDVSKTPGDSAQYSIAAIYIPGFAREESSQKAAVLMTGEPPPQTTRVLCKLRSEDEAAQCAGAIETCAPHGGDAGDAGGPRTAPLLRGLGWDAGRCRRSPEEARNVGH
jgi:type IV pilus assembly protein PilN